MELPTTIEEGYAVLARQEKRIEELEAERQDWIRLVRAFIDTGREPKRRVRFRQVKRGKVERVRILGAR